MLIDFLLLIMTIILLPLYYYTHTLSLPLEHTPNKVEVYYMYPGKTMRHAGFLPSNILGVYWTVKLLLPTLLITLNQEFTLNITFANQLIIGCFLFLIPDLWIFNTARSRKAYIEQTLSFYLDQVIAFLLTGQSLAQALEQATEHGLPPTSPLRIEMMLYHVETSNGLTRKEALTLLANRCDVTELKSFAFVLSTAFEIGGPVISTLKEHSDLLRLRQREKNTKRINSKMVASMVPLVLTNFPIFLLIVFFSPIIEFGRMFPQLRF
tara:strand:- start:6474 stop:7271 length:798 start_codon:yes stop_codon:yes gene_type:complete